MGKSQTVPRLRMKSSSEAVSLRLSSSLFDEELFRLLFLLNELFLVLYYLQMKNISRNLP